MSRSTVCVFLVMCLALLARADEPPVKKDEKPGGGPMPVQSGKATARPADDKASDPPKIQIGVPKSWDSEVGKGYAAILNEMNAALPKGATIDDYKKLADVAAEKLLEHARKHPTDASTLDALMMAVSMTSRSPDSAKTHAAAIDLLKQNFVKSPAIREPLRTLAWLKSDACDDVVREVIKSHPEKLTRARAARVFVDELESRVQLADTLGRSKEDRASYETMAGKGAAQKVIDGAARDKKEADELRGLLKTELKGELPNLEVGAAAPETTSVSLVKLSDLKGKVVVLDFWATWCGPCQEMIPHTRELVKSLDGKPFAFVSVSVDDEKETLTKFLAKEPMPWTHWWDGKKEQAEKWGVEGYPTLYVIDHKGVIRFKSVGYDQESKKKSEATVAELVKVAEADKK